MTDTVTKAVDMLAECFAGGGKLMLCGNGGSASDCAHILGELVKGFKLRRPIGGELKKRIGADWADKLQLGLPVIDLTANCALIAAVANDQDGLLPYAQQVLAYCREGDVLLGISTSGNAENVVRAMITARAMKAKTIALTGRGGGRMREYCDLLLDVDQVETYRVQEEHMKLYHTLCADIESRFFG